MNSKWYIFHGLTLINPTTTLAQKSLKQQYIPVSCPLLTFWDATFPQKNFSICAIGLAWWQWPSLLFCLSGPHSTVTSAPILQGSFSLTTWKDQEGSERSRKDLKGPERIWKVQKGSERSRKDHKAPGRTRKGQEGHERTWKDQEGPWRAKKDLKGHERTKKDLEGRNRTIIVKLVNSSLRKGSLDLNGHGRILELKRFYQKVKSTQHPLCNVFLITQQGRLYCVLGWRVVCWRGSCPLLYDP